MKPEVIATSPEGHLRIKAATPIADIRKSEVLVLNSDNFDTYIPKMIPDAHAFAVERNQSIAASAARFCHRETFDHFELGFNGMHFHFRIDQTPESAVAFYNTELEKDREAYKVSPEGIKAAQEREDRKTQAQKGFDTALANLQIIAMSSFPFQRSTTGATKPKGELAAQLCSVLIDLINNGDHNGVNYDRAEITNLLQSMGYVKDLHCGDKPESFDRAKTREWIVGQILSCIADDSEWKLLPPFAVSQIEKHKLHQMRLGD